MNTIICLLPESFIIIFFAEKLNINSKNKTNNFLKFYSFQGKFLSLKEAPVPDNIKCKNVKINPIINKMIA